MVAEEASTIEASNEADVVSVMGYGVQLTFDVPEGKHNGVLDVRVCWHDIARVLCHGGFWKEETNVY